MHGKDQQERWFVAVEVYHLNLGIDEARGERDQRDNSPPFHGDIIHVSLVIIGIDGSECIAFDPILYLLDERKLDIDLGPTSNRTVYDESVVHWISWIKILESANNV